MVVETVEAARALFERNGGRVVQATLHEDGGDRRVWFVRDYGWCFLVSDEKLLALANKTPQQPLVQEPEDLDGVRWPEGGFEA